MRPIPGTITEYPKDKPNKPKPKALEPNWHKFSEIKPFSDGAVLVTDGKGNFDYGYVQASGPTGIIDGVTFNFNGPVFNLAGPMTYQDIKYWAWARKN